MRLSRSDLYQTTPKDRKRATMEYSYTDVAKMIDHALLAPALTAEQLDAGIALARDYNVASVCIMPHALHHAAEQLGDTTVKASTVIGFPHGANVTAVKTIEAKQALLDGAQELDMVVNISRVKSHDWDYVRTDILAVLETTREAGQLLKVIFENAYLSDEEKIRLCTICGELGVHWVKTSTGFAPGGSTPDDLRLMREHSPAGVQIKAAGGIRSLDNLLEAREIGCTRVGASATAAILDDARLRLSLPPIEGPVPIESSPTY